MRPGYLILLLPFLFACSRHKKKHTTETPAATAASFPFDVNDPARTWILPDSLIEISGVAPLSDSSFLVIEDLHPDLYVLVTGKDSARITRTIPFKETKKEKFDFEDLAIVQDTVYALWSHGVIYRVSDWRSSPKFQKLETGLSKENNTEGMAYDPVTDKLLIACKNESGEADEKKSTRSVFAFDRVTDSLLAQPALLIRKKDFEQAGDGKVDFYPSAIAVQPGTNDLYILSTRGDKCLAVFSHEGILKQLTYLNRDLYLQPEGICFGKNGDLFISSEGKHGIPPKLFEIRRKEGGKEVIGNR